jgi:hypothetical protein
MLTIGVLVHGLLFAFYHEHILRFMHYGLQNNMPLY